MRADVQEVHNIQAFLDTFCVICAYEAICTKGQEVVCTGECEGIEEGEFGLECSDFVECNMISQDLTLAGLVRKIHVLREQAKDLVARSAPGFHDRELKRVERA